MDRRITDGRAGPPCSCQDTVAGWAGGEYRYYTPCRACESELFGSRVCWTEGGLGCDPDPLTPRWLGPGELRPALCCFLWGPLRTQLGGRLVSMSIWYPALQAAGRFQMPKFPLTFTGPS